MFVESSKYGAVFTQKLGRASVVLLALALTSISACKGGAASGNTGEACKADTDCKNGLKCEASVCVHGDTAHAASAAPPAAAPPAVEPPASTTPAPVASVDTAKDELAKNAEAQADAGQEPGPVPEIPTTKSKPPQGTEWDAGLKINTQNIHSQPDDCEMRVMREWLNVLCQGKIVSYEKLANFGTKNVDYFESVVLGTRASFVFRMKPGNPQTLRICREKDRATLLVSWPPSKDRPVHIALGKGPTCDEDKAEEDAKDAKAAKDTKHGVADKDPKKKTADKQPKKG